MQTGKTYIVEHLDGELGPWSELEYLTIARETQESGGRFSLTSVPPTLRLPESLQSAHGFTADPRSVEDIFAADKSRVCLLDPAAAHDLSPADGKAFDVFLFGGILGASLSPAPSSEQACSA